jgi:hypothetical protein
MAEVYKEIMMQSQSTPDFSLEKPIYELLELNIKTLENISYINPADLLNTKSPEELLEKNVDVLVKNSYQMLNYFHDACNIMEKYWLIFSYDVLTADILTAPDQQPIQKGPLYDLEKVIQDSRDVTKLIGNGSEKAARKNM